MRFPHRSCLFLMLGCLVPPTPVLFSPDNPCLSSCRLTPIFISHCVTHSIILKKTPYLQPPLLPLWGEALQTKCSPLTQCCPHRVVFAVYPSADSPHRFWQNIPWQTKSIKPKQVPLTQLPLFKLYGVHTWTSTGRTCYHLAPNTQVNRAIKTNM